MCLVYYGFKLLVNTKIQVSRALKVQVAYCLIQYAVCILFHARSTTVVRTCWSLLQGISYPVMISMPSYCAQPPAQYHHQSPVWLTVD